MFYRIDENNNIIDYSTIKYSQDCMETQKNIVRGFDGLLYFEEEINNNDYVQKEQKHSETLKAKDTIAELKQWFDVDYARLEQKYRRLIALAVNCDDGTDPSIKLNELYLIAEKRRRHIKELECV